MAHPHGEHARTVREGAFVLEQVQVHLADVVLQVERGGEVGLAVVPRANQHGLVGGVDALVPPQGVHLLELLLTRLACKCGYKIRYRIQAGFTLQALMPSSSFLYIYFWV